jgi:hypothetical protein
MPYSLRHADTWPKVVILLVIFALLYGLIDMGWCECNRS